MKLTATTSSFLLASMALSPSMVSAAPTGMEVPTSPNPAGSPNIRQFPPSPLPNDRGTIGSSPKVNHAPAIRTGPGSPRRSIPARMLKPNKRDGAVSSPLSIIEPLAGALAPVGSLTAPLTGPLRSITVPICKALAGLPLLGDPGLESVCKGLGLMNVDTTDHAAGYLGTSQFQSPEAPGNTPQAPRSAESQLGFGLAGLDGLPGLLDIPGSGLTSLEGLSGLLGTHGSTGSAELLPSQILGSAQGFLGSLTPSQLRELGLLPQAFGPVEDLPNYLPGFEGGLPSLQGLSGAAGLGGTLPTGQLHGTPTPDIPITVGRTDDGDIVLINGVYKFVPRRPPTAQQVPNVAGYGGFLSAEAAPSSSPSPSTPSSLSVGPPSPNTSLPSTTPPLPNATTPSTQSSSVASAAESSPTVSSTPA